MVLRISGNDFGIFPRILAVYHQRRCLEALHINRANTPLNRDDAALLQEAYICMLLVDDVIIGFLRV